MTEIKTGLELLREPFPAHQISKLPKGTKAQNDCKAEDKRKCAICGGWHHPQVIHLDYVGHAALTDRLLDCDLLWNWTPFALEDGLPKFDVSGGLWINLTVCGHTRPGYGNAEKSQYKSAGDREKETIGDALRNAAMRFGAALELWHKGELHVLDDDAATGKFEGAKVYSLKGSKIPLPNVDGMGDELPAFDVPEPEILPTEGEVQEPLLVPGSTLHKTIEGLIVEYQIEREIFKQWLVAKNKIGFKGERPSLSTMSIEDAKNMVLKWNPTVMAYNKWLLKQSGGE